VRKVEYFCCKMNVLLLTTYPHGGAGVACRRLQAALTKINVQANTLFRADFTGRWPFLAERVAFLPWEKDATVRWAFSPANFGADISKHPAVQKADVIHLHWFNQGFLTPEQLGRLAKSGKPIVWTLHDMWAFTGGCHYNRGCDRYEQQCGQCPYLRWPSDLDLSAKVWQRKAQFFPKNMQIVTCSQWLGARARASRLMQDFAVTSIPNPIDTEQFKLATAEQRKRFRQQLGVPDGVPLLLFAAMNIADERKGFKHIEAALQLLKVQQPELDVQVVAIGKYQQGALDGIPYKVHALGQIADPALMVETYACCDIFVTPALEENLPNTIMESMACGTPVIGFSTGGIPEMIDHEMNGYVVPLRDEQQLSIAIARALSQPKLLLQMRDKARAKVMSNYAEQVVAQQYCALYEQLLKN
jgi:glycosyltransferase involved in cell wall biosynthesis